MARNVNEVLALLSASRRRKIEERLQTLMDEEAHSRELRCNGDEKTLSGKAKLLDIAD